MTDHSPKHRLHYARQAARLTPEQAAELRTFGRLEGEYFYLPLSTYWTFRQKVLATRAGISNLKSLPHAGSNSPPLPSLPAMAANAGRALIRSAIQLATGRPLFTTPEEESRRLAICRGIPSPGGEGQGEGELKHPAHSPCEHYRVTDGRCAKCGCHTARLLRKTRLAAEHCPVGKW